MQPIITIFCAFTRQWAIDGWLKDLDNVRHDPPLTNLCVIIDCDEPLILNKLKKFAEERNYRSFYHKMNTEWSPNETRLSIRRMRVADVHNQSKDLIAQTDGEIIICLEDDTVFDRLESFERLYQPLLDTTTVGFVEGVQMGRWGAQMIGAWKADDNFSPTEIKTLLPQEQSAFLNGYEPITGGGWYGYATRRGLYLNCEYYTSSAQPWGPDVNFGFWLRQKGFTCLIDWDTIYGHRDYNKVLYPDDPKVRLAQIVYNKDLTTGKWHRRDYEPSRS